MCAYEAIDVLEGAFQCHIHRHRERSVAFRNTIHPGKQGLQRWRCTFGDPKNKSVELVETEADDISIVQKFSIDPPAIDEDLVPVFPVFETELVSLRDNSRALTRHPRIWDEKIVSSFAPAD
jgi:hypothetical protein